MEAHLDRRAFLRIAGSSLPALALGGLAAAEGPVTTQSRSKTEFQIACMTLPYAQFPLERALGGIQSAGYRFVAWGTTHKGADGKSAPVIAANASAEKAAELGKRCRDLGLKPLLMFSGIYPEAKEAVEVLTNRIRQAAAAGIPQVLTFGHSKGGNRDLWIQRLKQLGPVARDHGVTIVVKQHGGETGTGAACAEIIREVANEGVKVNDDAGNVMDYLNVDPLSDIQSAWRKFAAFASRTIAIFRRARIAGLDSARSTITSCCTTLRLPI